MDKTKEFIRMADCPFSRIKDKYGDADCWLYEKSMVVKLGERPDFCKIGSITVKLRKK